MCSWLRLDKANLDFASCKAGLSKGGTFVTQKGGKARSLVPASTSGTACVHMEETRMCEATRRAATTGGGHGRKASITQTKERRRTGGLGSTAPHYEPIADLLDTPFQPPIFLDTAFRPTQMNGCRNRREGTSARGLTPPCRKCTCNTMEGKGREVEYSRLATQNCEGTAVKTRHRTDRQTHSATVPAYCTH